MKIELNIEKKYFLVITAALLIFSAVLMVTAYNSNWANSPGAPTTVGHSPDELVGSLKCGTGQALTITASGFSCVSAGGGSLTCYVSRSTTTSGGNAYATCAAGEKATGGGCAQESDPINDPDVADYASWPISSVTPNSPSQGETPTGWACDTNSGTDANPDVIAFAICCR